MPKTTYDQAAWLAAIVEASNDAIIGKSLEGVIRSWNAGAERLFGYAAQEAIGQGITILLPSERLHEEADLMRRIHKGERVDRYETVRVRKDGTQIPVSVTLAPITDGDGSIVGVAKIARDIRTQREAQSRLRADEPTAPDNVEVDRRRRHHDRRRGSCDLHESSGGAPHRLDSRRGFWTASRSSLRYRQRENICPR